MAWLYATGNNEKGQTLFKLATGAAKVTRAFNGKSKLRRKNHVPWQEIDDEGMLLKLETGDYFSIAHVGLFIWKHLDGSRDLEAVSNLVISYYDVRPDQAGKDLHEFVRQLLQLDFLEFS